jgi:hypothetical protein
MCGKFYAVPNGSDGEMEISKRHMIVNQPFCDKCVDSQPKLQDSTPDVSQLHRIACKRGSRASMKVDDRTDAAEAEAEDRKHASEREDNQASANDPTQDESTKRDRGKTFIDSTRSYDTPHNLEAPPSPIGSDKMNPQDFSRLNKLITSMREKNVISITEEKEIWTCVAASPLGDARVYAKIKQYLRTYLNTAQEDESELNRVNLEQLSKDLLALARRTK